MIDLEIKDIKISEILLDPNNPRYAGKNAKKNQKEILDCMLKRQETKELMNSMKLGLQWVNRIVVRKVNELPDEIQKELKSDEILEYIVVEGNTRLACLKSETLKDIYGEDMKIPVLVANKGDMSEQEFENEIKIIQARSNVMIVKQWEDAPKFRHIYNMYIGEKEINPNDKFQTVVDKIKNTTGGKTNEVKTAICRCLIVDEIASEADELEEIDWPYLEAFEANKDTRKTIGINDNYDFDFSGEDGEIKKELLFKIPSIIKSAKSVFPNGKKFRDKYKEIIEKNKCNSEKILEYITDIMDPNTDKSWFTDFVTGSVEEKWDNELDNIYKTLKAFPTFQDWASKKKKKLEDMQKLIEKILNTLD